MKKISYILTTLAFLTQVSCGNNCSANSNCNLSPEAGDCEAIHVRFFFNQETKKCEEFIWGGCQGIVPFETFEQCKECLCHK